MKDYVVIYKNGGSQSISKLDEFHLQILEDGYCEIYDVTNPKIPLQIIIKKVKGI